MGNAEESRDRVQLKSGRRTTPSMVRNVRRGGGGPASFTATEAKNEFGRILENVIQGEMVVITRHDAPKAVLMSMDKFHALSHAPQLQLDSLSSEFDALLGRMQTSKAEGAMETAFHATPRQLGKAAVAAARKRG